MAESGSLDCPCSNISIMQLFHELKQRYPNVPDQIVSKVIQENCHDKNACAKVLEKENGSLLHTYPGAIISGGNAKEKTEGKTVCSCCEGFKVSPQGSSSRKPNRVSDSMKKEKVESAFLSSNENCIYLKNKFNKKENDVREKDSTTKENKCDDLLCEAQREGVDDFRVPETCYETDESGEIERKSTSNHVRRNLTEGLSVGGDSKVPPHGAFPQTGCDCDLMGDGSHWCHLKKVTEPSEPKTESSYPKTEEQETVLGKNSCSEKFSVHNYQIAVQYCLEAGPCITTERKRSFTTVNLNVRPPSSQPQPPIEIQSGRNLTYSSSVYDAKNGVQSNFQIVIGPGCGGAMPSFRTCITSPESQTSSFESSCCSPNISAGFCCHSHRLKALLKKQRERKNRMARELRKEQDRLRHMQNEVKLMKAAIALKSSPHVLPKLKTEVERLRAECEKLTAAVDLYSDNQNVIPLGETDEEFYRNIYTGQRLQREGSWNCQLCTFRNHPLLTVCEECDMPRISLGSTHMDVAPSLSNVFTQH